MIGEVDLATLRDRAEAADHGGRRRPWVMSSDGEKGYPQNILVKGPALLVCTCYEGPQYPPVWADYITTFDPPMALRLLDVADAAVTMADPKWRTLSLADFQLRMERLVGAVGALMAPRPNW